MNIRANSNFRPGNLAALEERIVPRIIAAMKTGTGAVKEEAVALAPKRSGDLISKISALVTWEGQKVTGSVISASEHASFVEFGTGLHGSGTYPYDLPKTGVPYTGAWKYDFRDQGWIGMPAQPHMRPALDGASPNILLAFQDQGFKL